VSDRVKPLLQGLCIGAADVVPGVSGGTMALILGIYERLLHAIRSVDLHFLRLLAQRRFAAAAAHVDLVFLLMLGAGIVCAIAFFTRVVRLPELITTHPEPVYGLFFGLIVASICVLLQARRPLTPARLGWILLGTLGGFAIVNLVPVETPTAGWFVFLCGVVAISAMILPGISGSFILLVLNKYAYVFDALGRLDISVIAPFALGCACGLAVFSRFLNWLLGRFHDATLLTIVGVLTGSLWMIWPFQERSYQLVRGKERLLHSVPTLPQHWDASAWTALALAGLGAAAVLLLQHAAARQRA
jgi:putative membrane protein